MMAELPKIVHILGGTIVFDTAVEKELQLDKEWVELIKKALELGIPIDEIRDFLNK
jgi:hypothetical protein